MSKIRQWYDMNMERKEISIRSQVGAIPTDKLQHVEALLTSESAKSLATNVLIVAGVVGLIGVAFTAPNTLKLLRHFTRKKYGPLTAKQQKQKLLKALYYLKQSGQITLEADAQAGLVARLTEVGYRRFSRIQEDIKSIQRPNVWAGTWWLVAADIPTKQYRIAADMFRLKLRQLKFYPLQRTLWIYPYNPMRELEYVVNKFHIGRFVTLMEVKRIDLQDKKKLVAYFKNKHIL